MKAIAAPARIARPPITATSSTPVSGEPLEESVEASTSPAAGASSATGASSAAGAPRPSIVNSTARDSVGNARPHVPISVFQMFTRPILKQAFVSSQMGFSYVLTASPSTYTVADVQTAPASIGISVETKMRLKSDSLFKPQSMPSALTVYVPSPVIATSVYVAGRR